MLDRSRPFLPAISVVVPAFNEARNLPTLLAALERQLTALVDRWEVLVVDDGSTDDTAAVVAPWLARANVRYLQLSRNFGKEHALTAGIDHAAGDVVVLMDADLQHPVTLIEPMLTAWRGGADMVCATRASRADEAWAKRLGSWLFYRLVNSNGRLRIPVDAGDFRLMDRRVVEALRSLPERNRFMKGLYAWVGFKTELIDYVPPERLSGNSHFSMHSLMHLALTGVTGFSNVPLRVWSAIGAAIAVAAMAFGGLIMLEHFVVGHEIPGWATLAISLMFFSGVQLLSIGILGEYVGRIFDEVKGRPIYLVAHDIGHGLRMSAERPAPQWAHGD